MGNENHGKWKIASNYINGKTYYAIYRLKDVGKIDHSGNREYISNWTENRQMTEEAFEAVKTQERLKERRARLEQELLDSSFEKLFQYGGD